MLPRVDRREIAAIFAGGALGTLARAALAEAFPHAATAWPWPTFGVNIAAAFLLAPGDGTLGLAVRCPACGRVSVNLVSHEHVDLPFHNDREIGVVPHVFATDAEHMVEEFRTELDSWHFDARRLLD